MAANTGYILPLHEVSRADLRRSGAKAARLGELLRAGFRVPDGFVLAVEAFERFRGFHGFGASTRSEDVAAAHLPDDIVDVLLRAHERLAAPRVAVRSSGVAEDRADASFAGQYETSLGVQGQPALLRAIVRCWSSAFSQRVAAYHGRRGGDGVPPLAVLVQRLIDADAAGVAFTANPLTGDRDEVVISAVRGLGERLVSGAAQPDEWLVRGRRAECHRAPEAAIDARTAARIAGLARRVEKHFGGAQDIEWAFAGKELYLLQARPVTALPARAGAQDAPVADPPEGYWQREASHFPRPLTPLAASLFLDTHNTAMREMFSAYGLLLEAVEMREIGGWVYARAVPLGGKDRRTPPAWLLWMLVRAVPALRRRTERCREAIRSDLHGGHIDRWYSDWRPDLARRIGALTAVDLPTLPDAALGHHLDAVGELADECVRIHFLLHGAMLMVLGEFAFTCRDLLGWPDRRMLELLDGLSDKSSEPARRLADLARIAAESDTVRTLLTQQAAPPVEIACAADGRFGEAFEAYQREYGCRALGYELVEETLAERPGFILRLVRDQISRGYDPDGDARVLAQRRGAAVAEARRALAGRDGQLARFERALARAERAYPVREDSEFYTVSAPLGIARYAYLEVGRRLAGRGLIGNGADVFLLTVAEARQALGSAEPMQAAIGRRRGEREHALAHPGPASYGMDPGRPPSARALPGEARFAMEALQWVMLDRILATEESQRTQAAGDRLAGIAASVGRYTGPVRVVMDETEFDKVQPGDVLVCPITSPVWSILFPSIGALVTDTGGILSHAAIIAREYRLPSVVGTGNATALLADGQLVTVDGQAGIIEVGDRDPSTEAGPVPAVDR